MMRRSPVTVGLVLGLVVGLAGAGALAATSLAGKSRLPGVGPLSGQLYSSHPIDIRVRGTLPSLGGSARAYRLPSAPEAGAVERLANALGVRAPVIQDAGGWVVRDATHLVRVDRAPGVPWFLATLDGPCVLVPGERAYLGGERLPPVPSTGPTDCPDGSSPSPAGALDAGWDPAKVALEAFRHAGAGDLRLMNALGSLTAVHVDAVPVVGGVPTSRVCASR